MEKKKHLSYSTACKLLANPLPIAFHKIHEPFEPTDAMTFGSLVDCLMLEPGKFTEKFMVLEGKSADGRSKEGKEARKQAKEKNLTPIKPEVLDDAELAVARALSHDEVAEIFKSEDIETQVKVEGSVEGSAFDVPTLGFVDIWCPSSGTLMDLKVVNNTVFEKPEKTIFDRNYHLQLAMYDNALGQMSKNVMRKGWVVVSSQAPFHVEVWWMDNEWEDHARKLLEKSVKLFEDYLSYSPDSKPRESRVISPLGWMLK